MKYYVTLEVWPTEEHPRSTETKTFEHSDSEPITPYAKACEMFTKERIIDIISEEDM